MAGRMRMPGPQRAVPGSSLGEQSRGKAPAWLVAVWPAPALPAPYRLPSPNRTAAALTAHDFEHAAQALVTEVAVIQTVAAVESAGRGFLRDGRPKILFEAHRFGKLTHYRYNATHPNISVRGWTKGLYKGGTAEYDRLAEALALDHQAALEAASWGKFQILGSNYYVAGHTSVEKFVEAMYLSEGRQLDAFVQFIRSNAALHRAVQRKDWTAFARAYNGAGYKKNHYDRKLKQTYDALPKGP